MGNAQSDQVGHVVESVETKWDALKREDRDRRLMRNVVGPKPALKFNPEFIPDPIDRPDIKIVNKGFFREREARTIPKHLTMTLPRGTLLFRGIYDEKVSPTYDFQGLPLKSDYKKRCISPNYQVYFYPHPYAVDAIVGLSHDLKTMVLYVTTRDIELLCLVSPSEYTRASTDTNLIQRCNTIQSFGCETNGKEGDACITPEYHATFPDVTGMIAIAGEDATRQTGMVANPRFQSRALTRYMGYQVGMISDARDYDELLGAVPEIVLSPFSRALKTDYVDDAVPLSTFKEEYKDILQYEVFASMPRSSGDETKVEEFMNRILSKDGYNGYHVAIDRQTGFYRVKELSDPFDSIGTMVRRNEPEFVFKRTKEFTLRYGRSRRMTRRVKKSRRTGKLY